MKEFKICKICKNEITTINKTFNLVVCNSCKLIFSKTIFSENDFIDIYDKLYNKTDQYKSHQLEFNKIKNNLYVNIGKPKLKILKFILKNDIKSITEIGAGIGLVANYLTKIGKEYYGIELDELTAKKAQSLKLNVDIGDFSKLEDVEYNQDAIIAFEVIEHLQDLNHFFNLVKSKLKKNGYLGFTVPNYEKIKNYKNLSDKIYQTGPPIHLNYFTIESIKNIAEFYNFKVLMCETKKTPYLNLNKIDTYKFLYKSFIGKYYGPTLICILRN